MPDEASSSGPASVLSQDVDRIRDILFGHQMREYEQRFQTMQRDLGRLQQMLNRLTERLAEQDSGHSEKLQAEASRLGQQLADQEAALTDKMAQDRQDLQHRLDQLGKQATDQASSLERKLQQEAERLGRQLTDQEAQFARRLQSHHAEMRQADDDLRQELREAVQKLVEDKTDRLALSEMFIQVGEQLKTAGSFPNLEELLNALGQETE